MTQTSSCSCHVCQSACKNKPGWFLPGEAEKAAALKGMTFPDFFRQYLGVDWWEADDPVFVLAPAIKNHSPGTEYPGNPRGECVFFVGGKCEIHDAKPAECKWYDHGKSADEVAANHEATHKAWAEHQGQIRELLGREPVSESFSIFDSLFHNH